MSTAGAALLCRDFIPLAKMYCSVTWYPYPTGCRLSPIVCLPLTSCIEGSLCLVLESLKVKLGNWQHPCYLPVGEIFWTERMKLKEGNERNLDPLKPLISVASEATPEPWPLTVWLIHSSFDSTLQGLLLAYSRGRWFSNLLKPRVPRVIMWCFILIYSPAQPLRSSLSLETSSYNRNQWDKMVSLGAWTVSPNKICRTPNPQYFRIWPLEIGLLQM